MSSGWKTLESRLIYKNPWIKLHEDKVKTPSGKTMLYSWYESADVVVIVPFIDDSTLLMLKQYRYPLHKVLLEFPAGHIENGENPKDTAARESNRVLVAGPTYHQCSNPTVKSVYLKKPAAIP